MDTQETGKTHRAGRRRIALLIETSNVYGRELLRGIHAWSKENDARWAFRLVEQGRGAVVPDWLAAWDGDGVIARVENELIGRALHKLGIPVVDVSAGLETPLFPQVVTDNRAVMRLAREHFASLGLKRMAFCGDRRFRWSRAREVLYGEAMSEAGEEPLLRALRSTRPEVEMQRLVKWLTTLPKPVGVLACYDIRGREVLEACREAKLRVPEEVAVLGIHNDEILCELCDPPLSSVMPNARRAGAEAAATLAAAIAGIQSAKRGVPQTTAIPPVGVIKRRSTDLVAIEDERISAALRYINENAPRGISVQDVLSEVPMARTQLERQFRSLLGCSPREQIERIRMGRVRELLLTSTLSIAAIAESTGFEYPESLTVAFKRVYGESPRRFRQREQR